MRSSTSSFVALGLLTLAFAACTSAGTDDAAGSAPGDSPAGSRGDVPQAPPVGGPAASEELTEKFGVFVTPSGADNADGTREHPLARIQPAIELAKKLGKRVYVCTGVYREALVLADSISVVGGLDCTTSTWRIGAPRSRVESPTSPAVDAKDIVSATRLESLDILAPKAVTPGGSSIALRATRASALIIASSRLVAGDAAKGDDGVEGVQLVNAATVDGKAVIDGKDCGGTPVSCMGNFKPPQNLAGTNPCENDPTLDGQPGGYGGTGGKWEVYQPAPVGGIVQPLSFRVFNSDNKYNAEAGVSNRDSAAGAAGAPGENGAIIGALSLDGYVPADGANGQSGLQGHGGKGGNGSSPIGLGNTLGAVWYGMSGASGGAGGCRGLAGTAGKGGGASIAALLIDGALTLDATEVIAGHGGAAGLGAFGSSPTAGGLAGTNATGYPALSALPGGRGGAAGVSGNGGTGPSIAVAHAGAAPKIVGATKLSPGAGGDAIAPRTRTDGLGITVTIPATPAGLAQALHAFDAS